MKQRWIKSLISAGLGLSLLLTPVPASASDESAPAGRTGLLTYEEAIERGVRKSAAYQSAELSLDQAKESNKDLVVYYDTYIPSLWQAKDDLKLAEKWAEKSLQLTKEQTAVQIRNLMDDISLQIQEKENLQKQIRLQKEVLRIDQLKYGNGIISRLDLQVSEMELSSLNQELISLEKKMEGDYIALYSALDLPVDKDRGLEYHVEYEAAEAADLDRRYTEALENDPYIWRMGEQIKSAQYKLDSYQYNSGGKNYKLTEMDVTQARLASQNARKKLKETIETRWNTLEQLQEGLKTLDLKEQQAKLALQTAEAKQKAGMGIALDVSKAEQQLQDLQVERLKLQQQHAQTKVIFETLYLKPDYAAS